MNPGNLLSQFTQYMYNHYSKDGGKLLVHLGAAGWAFGAIAQIAMLLGDKSIDKDQKKFLLPQEAADAAVNVVMYYSVCEIIKRFGDSMVEKGRFLTDDIAKEILKMKPSSLSDLKVNEWGKLFTSKELKSNLSELLSNPSRLNIFKKAPVVEKETIKNIAKSALEKLEAHKNNVGIVTAITGSVLACNVITPIVRNMIASNIQKKLQHKEAVEIRTMQIKNQITMKNPLPHSFKSFNNYNSFAGVKLGNM